VLVQVAARPPAFARPPGQMRRGPPCPLLQGPWCRMQRHHPPHRKHDKDTATFVALTSRWLRIQHIPKVIYFFARAAYDPPPARNLMRYRFAARYYRIRDNFRAWEAVSRTAVAAGEPASSPRSRGPFCDS
jgi:hypothetical protein